MFLLLLLSVAAAQQSTLSANVRPEQHLDDQTVFPWAEIETKDILFLLEEKIVYSHYPFVYHLPFDRLCAKDGVSCKVVSGAGLDWLVADELILWGTSYKSVGEGRVKLVVSQRGVRWQYLLPLRYVGSGRAVLASLWIVLGVFTVVLLLVLLSLWLCGICVCKDEPTAPAREAKSPARGAKRVLNAAQGKPHCTD